jgi:nucleotide-binding universal stress UspA family protein
LNISPFYFMRKIVVPTDFSGNAMQAAVCAAGIAAKCGATVYLLHAMDATTDPILEPVAMDTKFLERNTREEFSRLRSMRQQMGERHPQVPIELRLSKDMAADAILAFSTKEQADLLIMGVHGSAGLKEFLMGSVTADIIARSQIPVIAVPPEYRFHEARALLLATGKWEHEKAPLSGLIELAEIFGARVHVISHVSPVEGHAAAYLDATRRLDHYLGFLKHSFEGIEFISKLLEGDDLQEALDAYCRQHAIDMVAVFNHPRTLIDKLCRRNNTRRAVFHSHVPVLVLPVG